MFLLGGEMLNCKPDGKEEKKKTQAHARHTVQKMLSRLSKSSSTAVAARLRLTRTVVVGAPLSSSVVQPSSSSSFITINNNKRSYTTFTPEELEKRNLEKKIAAGQAAEPTEMAEAISTVTEQDKAAIKVLGGLPETQHKRHVIIHQPARNAMQQGVFKHQKWRMEWVRDANYGQRWADPLMGWTASSDPLNTTYLYFETLERAVEYAQKHGYTYAVEVAAEDNQIPNRAYADKFTYVHPSELEQW